MKEIVLFCASYNKDMHRAKRMAESVNRFNIDNIPLYLCVPEKDLSMFQEFFGDTPCNFLTDQEILNKTEKIYGPLPKFYPGHLLQQLIKLEFWRMGFCHNYAWLDSDSYFIRPFGTKDFFYDATTPYTIMNVPEELFEFAEKYNKKVKDNFINMAEKFKKIFNRSGENYDFGYPVLIWSCKVLKSLYEEHLLPENKTIYELLYNYPCEMQIYGEYVLYSKKIPVVPSKLLFKFFHYKEQFFESQMMGESEYSLAKDYMGIVMQSNWTKIEEKKKNNFARFKNFLNRIIQPTFKNIKY